MLAWSLLFGSATGLAANLTLACHDVGRAVEACERAAQAFAERSGHQVRVVAAQGSGRSPLARYRALFEVSSPRIDVLQFPEGWLPALAIDLATLPPPSDAQGFIGGLYEAGEVGGRRVALPHHLAVTVLFLRSDVIEPDLEDWAELRASLLDAPSDAAAGLAFGAAGPSLFPFVLDWLLSFGIADLTDAARIGRALDVLNGSIGTLTLAAAPSTTPSEAVATFAQGEAAALVARSTALGSVERSTVAGAVETVLRPQARGADAAPILVSVWYVGVSRHSRHQEAAAALAQFLSAAPAQREAAVASGLAPTRTALYDDPDIAAPGTVFADLGARLDRLRLPPIARFGSAYLTLADAVSSAVRAMLRGEAEPDATAATIVAAAREAEAQRE